MAISRESSATNNGTTVTIGTHAANDTVIVLAYRDNSATAPTVPAGWNYFQIGSGTTTFAIGWKRATSASETSGTWTNATTLHALVYRGGTDTIVVPKFLSAATNTSTTIGINGQAGGSFEANDEETWLLAFIAQRNSSNNLQSATWTGLTNVTSSTDGSAWQAVANDSNADRTTIWSTTNAAVTNSAAWRTFLLTLQETPTQSASGGGGGIFFRPGMSGGMSE
jgi:hypothetical protein